MPGSVVNLDIAADPEEFRAAVEKTFREVAREASIPGFRKGKAPRQVLERMIGRDAIVAEAGRNMMDDLYQRALEEQDLRPVSEPMVDIYNEDPIAFRVVVEVFPTVELGDYKSVRIEPRDVDVTDEEVEEELEELLKSHSEWIEVPVARAPQEGDQVVIDLEVFEGDEHFQEPAENAEFVLGESSLFEALTEALKVMQPGTTSEVTLAFEEDDASVSPPLRGKTLRYVMTLKKVNMRKLPELTDEFVKEIGDFESVDELREEIRKDVLRNKAQEARNEVTQEAFDQLVEVSDVQVPATMVETELDQAVQQMRTRLQQQGLSLEDYLMFNGQTEEELRESFREDAEKRVRQSLVLQKISEIEGLEVTDEDIENEIENLVGSHPNAERMRQLYRSDYFRGMLENEVHDRKLVEFIMDLVTEGKGPITGPGADLLEQDAEDARKAQEEQIQAAIAEAEGAMAEPADDDDDDAPDASEESDEPDSEESEDDEPEDDSAEPDEDQSDADEAEELEEDDQETDEDDTKQQD